MVLIKYGKGIVDEQYILNRLANASIDIYTSAVAISRASRALDRGLPTANYEKMMAEAWTLEATDRVKYNLKVIESGKHLDNFTKLSTIAKKLCDSGVVFVNNPLGI